MICESSIRQKQTHVVFTGNQSYATPTSQIRIELQKSHVSQYILYFLQNICSFVLLRSNFHFDFSIILRITSTKTMKLYYFKSYSQCKGNFEILLIQKRQIHKHTWSNTTSPQQPQQHTLFHKNTEQYVQDSNNSQGQ